MHDVTHKMHKTPHLSLRIDMAGRVKFAQGQHVQPHQHSTWELVYYLEGNIQCCIGNEIFDCQPGVLLLTPPGIIHYEMSLTSWACYFIGIEAPPQYPWPRVYHDDANRTFEALCTILVREWIGQEADRSEMLTLLLNQFDILLQRTHAQHQFSATERLIRDVERYLEEHFAEPITINTIASEVGVSHSYLRAQFVRLRGQTPMAYLQALRVHHAVGLIRNSNLSLEAIASSCGYHSASHLSRHVLHTTGKRPGVHRRR